MSLPDNTPVLLGAGQVTERLDSPDYAARSPQDLAADAAQQALDRHGQAHKLLPLIDAITFTRNIADSVPDMFRDVVAPFGASDNFPRSVAKRIGANPEHAVYSRAGGDIPQILVAETCQRVAGGELRAGIVCGAEAIATVRHLQRTGGSVDWSESPGGTLDDRGPQIDDIFIAELARHGAFEPIHIYPLLENARRSRLGEGRADYLADMAKLFERFAKTANSNPLSMFHKAMDATAIASPDNGNRLIAEPYFKAMVAKDGVNQAAAIVITTLGTARTLGLEDQCVFLHGHAAAIEPTVLERPDLGAAPAMTRAYHAAIATAGISVDQIAQFDLYSCFPIAVSCALEALGIAANDPRPLTLTGGLPFFGGPINNYSLHAIAEAYDASVSTPDSYTLVGANGGHLSKHAVGVYSARPAELGIAAAIATPTDGATVETAPAGQGTIESYTYRSSKDVGTKVIAVIRLDETQRRCMAVADPTDSQTIAGCVDQDPLGRAVVVSAGDSENRFQFS